MSFSLPRGAIGAGFGLLVTQEIVQERSGTHSMEAEPGRGPLFRITLPQEENDFLSASGTGPGEI